MSCSETTAKVLKNGRSVSHRGAVTHIRNSATCGSFQIFPCLDDYSEHSHRQKTCHLLLKIKLKIEHLLLFIYFVTIAPIH